MFKYTFKFPLLQRHENENEITKMYLERKATHKKIKEDIKKNEKFLKVNWFRVLENFVQFNVYI